MRVSLALFLPNRRRIMTRNQISSRPVRLTHRPSPRSFPPLPFRVRLLTHLAPCFQRSAWANDVPVGAHPEGGGCYRGSARQCLRPAGILCSSWLLYWWTGSGSSCAHVVLCGTQRCWFRQLEVVEARSKHLPFETRVRMAMGHRNQRLSRPKEIGAHVERLFPLPV